MLGILASGKITTMMLYPFENNYDAIPFQKQSLSHNYPKVVLFPITILGKSK